ncbi:CCA tRNA nucleotidyltransferase [Devosia geojensis]|uniref:CCA tRNA nucleotidyltransferase n=1 Tax=Devosia geojensis TaxID=443610 RepID=UPI00069733CD|nr:CCA tRNA nucleotidyltransferase [Devosia geojensis]
MIGAATAEARLREAHWVHLPELRAILALLEGEEGRTRIVGGLVRDTILDLPHAVSDIDIATELLPNDVTERAREAGIAVYPTGIDHGTVTLRHGTVVAEVTTLRQDVETDGRHAIVRFGTDWVADASRRDFTLNALYADMDGALFDPLGGLGDCIDARVRFIGDPAQRIAEDGLRVYRFFRFSASHGRETFDPDGLEACAAVVGKLGHLSAERIGHEIKRMLGLPHVASTLRKMVQIGILDLPETVVAALRSYEWQVGEPVLSARLALILEDADAGELQARWRLSNEDIGSATNLRAAADLVARMRLHEAVYRYPGLAKDALDVAAVRAGWGEAGKMAVREKLIAVEERDFPLTGDDLVGHGLPPGPALGRELKRLERLWIESEFALDRDELLSKVEKT